MAAPALEPLTHAQHVKDLRDMWQGRALRYTRTQRIGFVVLSVLSHTYDEALVVLLQAVFPGYAGLKPPALVSAGRIAKSGAIVADFMNADGTISRNAVIYRSETALRDDFRKLADRLKLNDADRIEMFKVVLRWVVADTRLDPTMDPRDPDARRLVVH